MIHLIQKTYESQTGQKGPQAGLIGFNLPIGGTIKSIHFRAAQNVAPASVILNVRLNGVALWAGESRPVIAPGTSNVTKSGMAVACAKYDLLLLDVIQTGQSTLATPVTMIVEIEDGDAVPPGGSIGQILTKASGTDYDTEWVEPTGGGGASIAPIGIACSDEETELEAGDGKATFRMPFSGVIAEVRASLTTASGDGQVEIDIRRNGTTIFDTTLTIDETEKTTTTATTPAVLDDTEKEFDDDDEFIIDIDDPGDGATGLKIWFIFEQPGEEEG